MIFKQTKNINDDKCSIFSHEGIFGCETFLFLNYNDGPVKFFQHISKETIDYQLYKYNLYNYDIIDPTNKSIIIFNYLDGNSIKFNLDYNNNCYFNIIFPKL